MSETKELLRRGGEGFAPREDVMDSLIRLRARKQRNRRIATGVLAIVVALVSLAALVRTFRTVERPADEPTPTPTPEGIFADVGGWIAYSDWPGHGGPSGIWAVDPTRPNDPEARIQLSERPGEPLAWSSDGSKLLIWRRRQGPVGTPGCPRCAGPDWTGLFVLNADGTETRLVVHRPGASYILPDGSFSPDGSKVVFATTGGIYAVDADGGTPRLLRRSIRYVFVDPTYSPDGTKIAYFEIREGPGQGHNLRVMNADGTGDRVLLDGQAVDCYSPHLVRPAWSPDGTHIAFSCDEYGIRVVGADGSGLTTVIPDGSNPYWSPDGSRIAFELPWRRDPGRPRWSSGSMEMRLAIANADGTHVQVFQYRARAGPWNPLPLSKSGDREPATAEDGSGAAPLVYATVLLGVVGVLFLAWRARRRTGAS